MTIEYGERFIDAVKTACAVTFTRFERFTILERRE